MSTEEVFVQQVARLFHQYREVLSLESKQRDASKSLGPVEERNQLVAAARLAILELEKPARDNSHDYFANPGEAEWGC